LPTLRSLEPAAELAADHRRSADRHRRRDARTLVELSAAGHAGQGRTLLGAGGGDPGVGRLNAQPPASFWRTGGWVKRGGAGGGPPCQRVGARRYSTEP